MHRYILILIIYLTSTGGVAAMGESNRIIKVFNELRADNMHILDDFYHPDARFVDPISDLKGLDTLKAYYLGLYQNVTSIRFDFSHISHDKNKYVGVWTMYMKSKKLNKGKEIALPGVSHLHFDEATNKVIYHRDYFDMGDFIYKHIPVLGFVVKKINAKLGGH